ncbi:MAG: hypothetical protein VYD19_04520 [Myxococcota bacterium]|nr:hypothetical protein [Myxococcota bacterium]
MKGILCVASVLLCAACESKPCPGDSRPEGAIPPESLSMSCVIDTSRGAMRSGPSTRWYPGGKQKMYEYVYQGGIRHGDYTLWHRNGQVKERGAYNYGKRHGRFSSFWQNGQIREEGEFLNGIRNGDFKLYSDNGKSVKIGVYFMGYKHGPWVNKVTAINGRAVELHTYYESGRASLEDNYR